MNFSSEANAESVLGTIAELISEDTLAREVDEPIECSVAAFKFKVASLPIDHKTFHRAIAAFIQHVYESGLRLCRQLSDEKALSEAILLLNQSYENEDARGYDGALLDATGKGLGGLEMVLTKMAESIKAAERAKYIQWVFAVNLYCRNWKEKEDLVCAYLKQNKKYLPADLKKLNPARLVEYLTDLIANQMAGEALLCRASRAKRQHL